MQLSNVFNTISSIVRKEENYIPRDFKTIGGMWTVDTWKKDEVTYQIMDEGYTERIFTETVDVYMNMYNELDFRKGNMQDLEIVLSNLNV